MRHFIIGGARSGKSRFAESIALKHDGAVTYIATARVGDAEMAERIALHQARRPAHWGLYEAGHNLGEALRQHAQPNGLLLIDCLTLWLVSFLSESGAVNEELFMSERQSLLDNLAASPSSMLFISNEIGCGVVPMGQLTRWFVDELGRLNQDVAAQCESVTLISAGLPLVLKAAKRAPLFDAPQDRAV